MRLHGVDSAIRNNIPASTYEGPGAGLSAGSHMPHPGTVQASISDTARAEIQNASIAQSMMGGMLMSYGGPSAGPTRAEVALRSVSLFKHSSWGF